MSTRRKKDSRLKILLSGSPAPGIAGRRQKEAADSLNPDRGFFFRQMIRLDCHLSQHNTDHTVAVGIDNLLERFLQFLLAVFAHAGGL